MSGSAQITIVGRLSADPEMKYTQGGKAVTKFSIPVQPRKDGDTTWYRVTAWEKPAEVLNEHLAKGSWISVTGDLALETWAGKDGTQRTDLVVTVRQFTFVGNASDTSPARLERNTPTPIGESDLPF